jgi:hypothetical protein
MLKESQSLRVVRQVLEATMRFRLLFVALFTCASWTIVQQGAEAKSISMGALSRSAVKSACDRAGGQSFGINDETAVYGCANSFGTVNCTPDSNCEGFIQDMRPVAGNSFSIILGNGRSHGPTKVDPVDARVNPGSPP